HGMTPWEVADRVADCRLPIADCRNLSPPQEPPPYCPHLTRKDGCAANVARGTAGAVGFATAVGLGCTGSGPGVSCYGGARRAGRSPSPLVRKPGVPRRMRLFYFQRCIAPRDPSTHAGGQTEGAKPIGIMPRRRFGASPLPRRHRPLSLRAEDP